MAAPTQGGGRPPYQYMDSTSHVQDDDMAHVPVWQDSSAEHMYGDYVNPGGHDPRLVAHVDGRRHEA
ncbi:hypothetical protein SDRG_15236 [Saprolegnia diclina VS20]|uniref:Uncharacterized protein n=1 Tax=Saprolegnia diclina (strain VS20) TaxID=1156394 RepID=T0R4C6_SAPDV|nr:hypothetical protein SDRG_15236 [Saprolegnia diclina VS20]EQC26903.1 hypothetical protein SDRG_15236 [Saprolegnia diclina VS20]|eukprot:XP_008619624.1 hypothetical protein SDRG_15236 [Saprolegnia diclina VS20]